ncbi:hypothetical protein N7492_001714 [Penicillium capsulatum]|uniref:Uncharacterized protein n=1 Tax=Penicillium capsulatum TaxID=69766 RepID=A0A9W9ITS1_9EURO|nr:hypothetical protein N7492_001714 [Penicillium capsulatum]KAJ6129235.1 hypothetical protein N7512_002015 [Penicillium capsulatum]
MDHFIATRHSGGLSAANHAASTCGVSPARREEPQWTLLISGEILSKHENPINQGQPGTELGPNRLTDRLGSLQAAIAPGYDWEGHPRFRMRGSSWISDSPSLSDDSNSTPFGAAFSAPSLAVTIRANSTSLLSKSNLGRIGSSWLVGSPVAIGVCHSCEELNTGRSARFGPEIRPDREPAQAWMIQKAPFPRCSAPPKSGPRSVAGTNGGEPGSSMQLTSLTCRGTGCMRTDPPPIFFPFPPSVSPAWTPPHCPAPPASPLTEACVPAEVMGTSRQVPATNAPVAWAFSVHSWNDLEHGGGILDILYPRQSSVAKSIARVLLLGNLDWNPRINIKLRIF